MLNIIAVGVFRWMVYWWRINNSNNNNNNKHLLPVRSSPEFLFKGTSMNFDQWFYNVMMVNFLFFRHTGLAFKYINWSGFILYNWCYWWYVKRWYLLFTRIFKSFTAILTLLTYINTHVNIHDMEIQYTPLLNPSLYPPHS